MLSPTPRLSFGFRRPRPEASLLQTIQVSLQHDDSETDHSLALQHNVNKLSNHSGRSPPSRPKPPTQEPRRGVRPLSLRPSCTSSRHPPCHPVCRRRTTPQLRRLCKPQYCQSHVYPTAPCTRANRRSERGPAHAICSRDEAPPIVRFRTKFRAASCRPARPGAGAAGSTVSGQVAGRPV